MRPRKCILNNVHDVEKYIINYCLDHNQPITNLILTKILFYIQAAHLVYFKEPCFNDDFVHHRYGPALLKPSNFKLDRKSVV